MFVESKAEAGDRGAAWIGRVRFSKSGRTVYYRGLALQSCGGQGIRGNYRDVESGDEYWVSGPKRDGTDRHWAGGGPVLIDEDVVEEYWRDIRRTAPPKNPKLV